MPKTAISHLTCEYRTSLLGIDVLQPRLGWQMQSDQWRAPDRLADPGCRFAGRCPHVMDVCRRQTPGVHQVANRTVKCFLYDEAAVGAETVAHNVATATAGVQSIG